MGRSSESGRANYEVNKNTVKLDGVNNDIDMELTAGRIKNIEPTTKKAKDADTITSKATSNINTELITNETTNRKNLEPTTSGATSSKAVESFTSTITSNKDVNSIVGRIANNIYIEVDISGLDRANNIKEKETKICESNML